MTSLHDGVFIDFSTAGWADPEYEHAFRAYANYLEDLSGLIARHHGFSATLVDGVISAVASLPRVSRIQRRAHDSRARDELEACLRRGWSFLRRALREVEDEVDFDVEANGWLPEQAYYAVFHAGGALAVASGQDRPRDHMKGLHALGAHAVSGRLPFPWSARCSGCPQLGTERFEGLPVPRPVHVLSSPTPDTASDRLAMFLRTTREKELERLFDINRHRGMSPGKRRNLRRTDKQRITQRVPPTTVFDLLWRMRKKAHYDAPDTFVLGGNGVTEARHFAECLVLVTDATVAAIEALVCAYVGPAEMARMSQRYARKTACPKIAQRAEAWERQVSRGGSVPRSSYSAR
jgi:hypothetical protein